MPKRPRLRDVIDQVAAEIAAIDWSKWQGPLPRRVQHPVVKRFREMEIQEINDRARQVFESKEAAGKWFQEPCMGLDRQRPADLLETGEGRKLLRDHLGRLKHGVHT